MQTLPPAPPAPKRSRGKTILLTVLATVGILVVIGSLIDDDVTSTSASPAVDVEYTPSEEYTMEVVRLAWEMELTASERAGICDYYNTPPVGTTPEMVEAFADGAQIPYDEADRLLDQLLAEEC